MRIDKMVIVIRIIAAVLQGGVIGLERQRKQRPAGFRTHILVCLGAAILMMLSEELFIQYLQRYDIALDPSRITAQAVSGIGFLGAGTIIHYGNSVRGLTTAASLWAVAAIGLATGAGFYFLAFMSSAALFCILVLFGGFSEKYENKNSIELYVKMYNKPKAMGNVNFILAAKEVQIVDMAFIDAKEEDMDLQEIITVKIVIVPTKYLLTSELLQEIRSVNGVIDVERL